MLYRPTHLEVNAGGLFGLLEETELAVLDPVSPRVALEGIVLAALQNGPCYVAFSGGVDSSILLAVAANCARQWGLPAPVPVTKRFRAEGTDESQWQERVVGHLGLPDWIRLDLDDRLDLVGDLAVTSLRRHGLAWPAPLWADIPVFEAASGGCLLSGEGGDEILGWRRFTPVSYFLGGSRPNRERISYLIRAVAPNRMRRAQLSKTVAGEYQWLRPEPRAEVLSLALTSLASEPLHPGKGLEWAWRQRGQQVALRNSRQLGRDYDVEVLHPFFDHRFVDALMAVQGFRDWRGRAWLAQRDFGDLLPVDVLTRPTKAHFDHVYFGAATRAFAAQWDGRGVDEEVVDVDALRRMWRSGEIDGGTALLLQQARLAADVGVTA